MSMLNKKSIFESEEISKLSPLMQFFYYDLSIDDINQKLLNYEQKNLSNEKSQSRFNQVVNFAIKAFDEALKEIEVVNKKENSRRESKFTQINQAENSEANNFQIYFEELRNQFVAKFNETVSEENQKKVKIEKLKAETAENEKKIFNMMSLWDKKEENSSNQSSPKDIKIESLKKEMKELEEKSEKEIYSAIHDANLKMLKKSKAKKDIATELNGIFKVTQKEYLSELQLNLVDQKKLMEIKLKAEQALQTILLKFDSDVGSRALECDEIDEEMKEMRSNYEQFKSTTWIFQEEMYNRMLKLQEDERNAQLKEISENHAAKVIQKQWRNFQKQKQRTSKMKK